VTKFGNAKTYRIHATTWIIGIILLFLLKGTMPVWILLVVGSIIGFGLSGCVMTPYNMLAFVVDADQMITTKRREGIYAGVMTFLRKIAQAIALFSVGVGLDLIGYQKRINDVFQVQSSETLLGIKLMIFAIPILLLSVGIIRSFKFKIDPENHKILLNEINRLSNNGSKADASNTTVAIVEEITGIEYSKLWNSEDLL